jgi:hypothetical protein
MAGSCEHGDEPSGSGATDLNMERICNHVTHNCQRICRTFNGTLSSRAIVRIDFKTIQPGGSQNITESLSLHIANKLYKSNIS